MERTIESISIASNRDRRALRGRERGGLCFQSILDLTVMPSKSIKIRVGSDHIAKSLFEKERPKKNTNLRNLLRKSFHRFSFLLHFIS